VLTVVVLTYAFSKKTQVRIPNDLNPQKCLQAWVKENRETRNEQRQEDKKRGLIGNNKTMAKVGNE